MSSTTVTNTSTSFSANTNPDYPVATRTASDGGKIQQVDAPVAYTTPLAANCAGNTQSGSTTTQIVLAGHNVHAGDLIYISTNDETSPINQAVTYCSGVIDPNTFSINPPLAQAPATNDYFQAKRATFINTDETGKVFVSAAVTSTVLATGAATDDKLNDIIFALNDSPERYRDYAPSAPTNASVGTSSGSVLAANPSRNRVVLTNTASDPANVIFLAFGTTAEIDKGTPLYGQGGSFSTTSQQEIFAISVSGSANLAIQEFEI